MTTLASAINPVMWPVQISRDARSHGDAGSALPRPRAWPLPGLRRRSPVLLAAWQCRLDTPQPSTRSTLMHQEHFVVVVHFKTARLIITGSLTWLSDESLHLGQYRIWGGAPSSVDLVRSGVERRNPIFKHVPRSEKRNVSSVGGDVEHLERRLRSLELREA